MKKKIFCFLIVSFLLVITFSIFSYSKEINDTISLSINLFIKNVFPSLFPMFVISNLLVSIKTPKFLGNIFKVLKLGINNIIWINTNPNKQISKVGIK